MKKSSTILIIVIAVVVIIGGMLIGSYNGLATKKENVSSQYSNLDVALQRRADLIPNLVNTVKGFTNHENDVIDKITQARANLAGAKSVQEKADANNELTNSLNGLLVVVENYPDLKSSANFTQLSDELAGTENRIAVARRDYNDAVKTYNNDVIKFPGSIIAGMFNFEKAEYFEADEGSKEAPVVNFD